MKRSLVLVLTLLMVNAFLYSGCTQNPKEKKWDIDWKMYGMWIGEDGEVEEQIEFSISGKAVYFPDDEGAAQLEMAIEWPDSFRFASGDSQTYQPTALVKNESELFFIDFLLSDDAQTKRIIPADFGLAPDREYFLIYWEDVPGYLIAATDANVGRVEIEAYFSDMMTDERFAKK